MKCENCCKEQNGTYGSGRFCSEKCARGFSSKDEKIRLNKNSKISQTLKGKPVACNTPEAHKKAANTQKRMRIEKLLQSKWETLQFHNKKKRAFLEQGEKCKICGIKDWLGEKITFEFHHIDGNKKNDSRQNVLILCPNCHSQTPNYRWSVYASKKSKEKVSKNLGK